MSTQFTLDATTGEGFYVTVAEDVTVYEDYDDAIAEIQDKLATDTDSFLAELTVTGDGEDDVAVALEQVGWQQVIQDMAALEDDNDE